MTMDDLIAKLKERPKDVAELRDEQKQEWLRALTDLFDQVDRWLAPAIDAGVLQAARSETEIEEADFGDYLVPTLAITDGRRSVRLEPVGGRVVSVVPSAGKRQVGLRGRVDLIAGATRIPLVRDARGVWLCLPLRGEPRSLDADTLAEILREILVDE